MTKVSWVREMSTEYSEPLAHIVEARSVGLDQVNHQCKHAL